MHRCFRRSLRSALFALALTAGYSQPSLSGVSPAPANNGLIAPTSAKPSMPVGRNAAPAEHVLAIVEARDLTRDKKYADAVDRLKAIVKSTPGGPHADLQHALLVAQVSAIAGNENDGATAAALARTAYDLANKRNSNWSIRDRVQAALLCGDLADRYLRDKPGAKRAYAEVLQLQPDNKIAATLHDRVAAELDQPRRQQVEKTKLQLDAQAKPAAQAK
jgi:hypothetical protein